MKSAKAKKDRSLPQVFFSIGGRLFEGDIDLSVMVPIGAAALPFIREFIREKNLPLCDGFHGGFVGFISYELGFDWVCGASAVRAPRVPEAFFVYVRNIRPLSFPPRTVVRGKLQRESVGMVGPRFRGDDIKKYAEAFAAIQDLLRAGETYQVNFSQKFELPFDGAPLEIFAQLCARNPSSHQFFLETDDFAVISNSPECLMEISHDRTISTRPIKGTAPRGRSEREDTRLISQLMRSKKEEAELSMIVDLSRNDLGKVCVPGSVHVRDHRKIEKYSHVIHTVSTVEGRLPDGVDWLDGLHALFPGGSVTGCPKKRTMEIIQRLENAPRGAYCGSAGWIDLGGSCDFNIMIRTLWYDKKRKCITFRSGGGIVVDSKLESEFQELQKKAAALLQALATGA